ncbi:TPA: DUF551 domain-containing protein [Klebsiella pneumoniae]
MTTDITELAKAAEKYRSTLEAHRNNPRDGVALNAWDDATSKFMELVDNDELNIISGLLEALEKAKGMETYWKTQCRGITDHCEELQARIAELESHTVKPPVHPTVASENLDDETLQELIEFRRTTFEYHSKEGNKVQTIIHGVTLAALRELQERRKADSEPVAEVVSIYGDPEAFGEREIRPLVGIQQMPYGTKLYRHAQPAPEYPEVLPCSVLLEPGLRFGKGIKTSTMLAALARRAVHESDMAALSPEERVEFQARIEDFKALIAQPAPVVPDKMTAIVKDEAEYVEGWNACRAAMLAADPQLPGSEPATVPGKWIPVRERMPEKGQAVLVYRPKAHEGGDSDVRVAVYGRHNFEHGFGCYWEPSHWMPLPAAPQEVGDA